MKEQLASLYQRIADRLRSINPAVTPKMVQDIHEAQKKRKGHPHGLFGSFIADELTQELEAMRGAAQDAKRMKGRKHDTIQD